MDIDVTENKVEKEKTWNKGANTETLSVKGQEKPSQLDLEMTTAEYSLETPKTTEVKMANDDENASEKNNGVVQGLSNETDSDVVMKQEGTSDLPNLTRQNSMAKEEVMECDDASTVAVVQHSQEGTNSMWDLMFPDEPLPNLAGDSVLQKLNDAQKDNKRS
ncbi:hypothetical protein RFI_10774 [Reticulomyxa filosa]|uniref:Uncharacterized protein n=1 Tax=Reticulomyxa filosa TaxID=46433 RepID=X6NK82_RETFI|nr:hypothetical protein RFI_10774 [Reticulomyxa filosa]|eukprot:ETO26361.1 hypothetical protein RFI_10774 [Reticulomyxa filosa]